MYVFPLKVRKLIRGFQAHITAGLGGAADYEANHVSLYAPFDCIVNRQYFGADGGNWLWLPDPKGNMWEFAHLSEYKYKVGDHVKAGQVVAVTGNTGNITSGPHLHLQVIAAGHNGSPSGPRLNPETLLLNATIPMPENHTYDNKLIRLGSTLEYALVVRAKKYIFPSDTNTHAVMLVFEKTGAITVPHVTQSEWDSLPNSISLAF